MIARVEPREEVVIRLACSRGVGRPNYSDLSPGGSLSYAPTGNGKYEAGIELGNAALKL